MKIYAFQVYDMFLPIQLVFTSKKELKLVINVNSFEHGYNFFERIINQLFLCIVVHILSPLYEPEKFLKNSAQNSSGYLLSFYENV